PANDTGVFNLRLDGSTVKTDAACGTGTTKLVTTVGAHTDAERGRTDTSLYNYSSVTGGDCSANGSITLAAGDDKTCTITNTRPPPLHDALPSLPANDTGVFNLRLDGSTVKTDAACGTGTTKLVTTVGAH